MSEEYLVTFNLELNVEQAYSEIRKLQTLLFRTFSIIRRLGLPENIEQAITTIQRLIMIIRLLHTTMIAFEAATGPIGYALAGLGVIYAGVAMTNLDLTQEIRSHG